MLDAIKDFLVHSIGAGGATALAEALKVNRTLTTLDLRNNSIGTVGASALKANARDTSSSDSDDDDDEDEDDCRDDEYDSDTKVVFVSKPRAVARGPGAVVTAALPVATALGLVATAPLPVATAPLPVATAPVVVAVALESQYTIRAGVLTRLGEDIYQFALTAGALTAEAVLAHFNGADGVTLHDIHTRFYTSRRFNSPTLDLGCTVVVFRDGQWTRGVVGKVTSSAVFITTAEPGMADFWLCRRYEFMYVERGAA